MVQGSVANYKKEKEKKRGNGKEGRKERRRNGERIGEKGRGE
jgi:hypothetical protein